MVPRRRIPLQYVIDNRGGNLSTLLVEELFPGLQFEQPVRVHRDLNLTMFRPWIYKQGTLVDGEFVCEIYQGATKLAESRIDYTTINSEIPGAYSHGMIRFDFVNVCLFVAEGVQYSEYIFKLYMDNHTKNVGNFIGLCRDFENPRYIRYGDVDINNEPLNDSTESIGLELFSYEGI
jgi:hypothetical protein